MIEMLMKQLMPDLNIKDIETKAVELSNLIIETEKRMSRIERAVADVHNMIVLLGAQHPAIIDYLTRKAQGHDNGNHNDGNHNDGTIRS